MEIVAESVAAMVAVLQHPVSIQPVSTMPVRLNERGALNRRCAAMSCSRFCLVSI